MKEINHSTLRHRILTALVIILSDVYIATLAFACCMHT